MRERERKAYIRRKIRWARNHLATADRIRFSPNALFYIGAALGQLSHAVGSLRKNDK